MSKLKLLYLLIIIGLTVFIAQHISTFYPQQRLNIMSSVQLLTQQIDHSIRGDPKSSVIANTETVIEGSDDNIGTFRKHAYTDVLRHVHVHQSTNPQNKDVNNLDNKNKNSHIETKPSIGKTSDGSKKEIKVNTGNSKPKRKKKKTAAGKAITESASISCPPRGSKLVGPLFIDQQVPKSMDIINKEYGVEYGGTVEKGGWWSPTTCKPRIKMALIIPYRKRFSQLKIFLRHMHPFLQRQQLFYRIIVVEQLATDPFNRAGLFNVGFAESLKISPFECFVFSDVDLLPEDDRNYYGCPTSPRHMSVGVDKFNYQLPYETIFGGVGAFTKDHFEKINGMSNLFWGWGGEDDDLYQRIKNENLPLTRPSMQLGRYTMIRRGHYQSSRADPNRMNLLRNSKERMVVDGLNTLKYDLKEVVEEPLVTFVKIRMKKSDYFQ